MIEPTDLDLITIHTVALFTHDADGRIISSNEPDPIPAPRLYIGRSREGNVWRFRTDVPEDLAARLEDVLRREPPAADLESSPICLPELTDLLSRHAPVSSIDGGPAWLIPDGALVPDGVSVTYGLSPEQIQSTDHRLGADVALGLLHAAVVIDGQVASRCRCSRLTPDAAEAGLITYPEFRGRGYGVAVTAAWAAAVRASGRIPLYSTSWDNLASRRVAAKLGAQLYGADFSIA